MKVWYLYYNEEEQKVAYAESSIPSINADWSMPSNIDECKYACNTCLETTIKATDGYNEDMKKGLLTIHKCKDCGTYFFTNVDEEEWYKGRGMSIPKRCETCRRKRRKSA